LMIHHQASVVVCAQCRSEIAHPIRFCPHCGARLGVHP
jgi:rRNA maturation endonuclease Nob1